MKLFKSLLVAPATIGLLAPLSATANEINLADVTGYSSSEEVQNISEFNPAEELAVTNSRVDGLEARFNDLEAGSFSTTTAASFSVDMSIGAQDNAPYDATTTVSAPERIEAAYSFQMDLTTSFTGEDSLDISIDAGNAGGATAEFDGNTGGDGLVVDGVAYTFPVGDATVFVGDNMDGSTLYNTACVYGGPSNTLDDCGNVNSAFVGSGTAAGASYDFGNGFTGALGYAGNGSDSTAGLMTEQGDDAYGGQLTYTADRYGASVTWANVETAGVETRSVAFNGYWTPETTGLMPSVSVGYEQDDSETVGVQDTTSYMVGFQWDEVGSGTLGTALGTLAPYADDADELMMYEVFYSYPINDGMTITPLVYFKEAPVGSEDITGVMVKTSFSF